MNSPSVLAVEVFSAVLAFDTNTVTHRLIGGVTSLNDLLAAEGQQTGTTIPGLSNKDPEFAIVPTESTFNFQKDRKKITTIEIPHQHY